MPNDHMKLAEDLLYTCYQTYAAQPTYLAPEITYFNEVLLNFKAQLMTFDFNLSFNNQDESDDVDLIVKPADAHNLLRPETVESLWYMYHLTGNVTYQEWGWKIFQVTNSIALQIGQT